MIKKGKLWIGALGMLAALSFGDEDYSQWAHFRMISINTTESGANVPNAVANFPVLVRLTSEHADVFTNGGAEGASIRFLSADGSTRLPHERERWDAANQVAEFWVLVPNVAGNSTTNIRMVYGKNDAEDLSNGAAVFDTALGFRAVYHMNGGAGNGELDATALENHMVPSDSVPGAQPTDTAGAIGPARTFAGDYTTVEGRQYLVAPNTAAKPELNWTGTGAHTVSAWVYARAISNLANHGNSIFNKGDRQYAMQVYGGGGTNATTKFWESAVYSQSWRQGPSNVNATTDAWFFITGTWSGGETNSNATAQVFVNGALDGTHSLAIGNGSQFNEYNLFIGVNPNGGGTHSQAPGTPRSFNNGNARYWNGHLDEIRLQRGVASADYVKLAYETQKPGATAVSVGGLNVNVRNFVNGKQGLAFSVRATASGYEFSIPAVADAKVSVVDVHGREVWSHAANSASTVAWNGLTANGTRVAPGAYVARVTVKGAAVAQRTISIAR